MTGTRNHPTALMSGVKILLIIIFFSSVFVFNIESIKAGTITSNKDVSVTLTISDNEPPSTPILISPEDNTFITISLPTFTWQESSDNFAVGTYTLYLNGEIFLSDIPTTATENSDYSLTYNSITGYYSLTLKNSLSDGTYTWKIRAQDAALNYSDSVTWTFTLDTLAPSFVVTQLGNIITAISAQDPSTIPSVPIELSNNEPLIVATGEANSTVEVTLTIPGDPTQYFTINIDENSNWELQLGILPREVTMTLNFIITDQANHISVLNKLSFFIKKAVIIFPPSSPSPTLIPGTIPTPTPPPLIKIPIIPPREAIAEIIQEIIELLPKPIKKLIAFIPEGVSQALEAAAPISVLIVSTTAPIVTTAAIATQFGSGLSINLLTKIFQALGLIPTGKPQGIVFDSKTYEPVPFALITISSNNPDQTQLTETVVTDVNGIYRGIKLTTGTYTLIVSHQDFNFPTALARPSYLTIRDFYKGENFKVTSEKEVQLFVIPIDPIKEKAGRSFKSRFRIFLSRLSRFTNMLMVPLFFISMILAILYPSVWNYVVLSIYAVIIILKAKTWIKKPIIKGLVTDEKGQALEGAIVRLSDPQSNELISVIRTNKAGKFSIFAKKGLYHIEITIPGYTWHAIGEAAMSFHQINATTSTREVTAVMQSVQNVYEDLFGKVN